MSFQIWAKFLEIECPNNIEVVWKKAMEEVIKARISELVRN